MGTNYFILFKYGITDISGNRLPPQNLTFTTNPLPLYSKLVMGYNHACVLTINHKIFCWGNNEYGQLGNESTQTTSTPVPLSGPTANLTFLDIFAGGDNTCAIDDHYNTYCWGSNDHGVLGIGNTYPKFSKAPLLVKTPSQVKYFSKMYIEAGGSCAISENGSAYCWGDNTYGRAGQGWLPTTTDILTPEPVVISSGVGLSFNNIVGNSRAVCALGAPNNASGTPNNNTKYLYCWGAAPFDPYTHYPDYSTPTP